MARPYDISLASPATPPDVGGILRHLRRRHSLSLHDVALRSGLSQSFLSALERNTTDIALGRLAKLAAVFDCDIAEFLGFSARFSSPYFLTELDRFEVDRGEGVQYRALRVPGVDFEIDVMDFAPGAAFANALAHEGVDVVLVTSGAVVLTVGGVEYHMRAGDCATYSAGYEHHIRNAGAESACVIGLTTGRMP